MISLPSDAHRTPNLIDGLFYYGADTASSALQDYAEKELKARRPDWGSVFLSMLGIVVAESIKAGINQIIYPPFKSLRSVENTRRAQAR